MTTPCIVILAAGKGTRMRSALPKVLHRLAGRSLLEHVADTARKLSGNTPLIIVTGHGGETVQATHPHLSPVWVTQKEQLGTGHALLAALPAMPHGQSVLVLYGDVPLVSEETLRRLIDSTPEKGFGLVTATVKDPSGLGRIVRDQTGKLLRIVEDRDATPEERTLNEINTGIYLVPDDCLRRWLPALTPKNAQGEFYLTDIVPAALAEGLMIHTIQPACTEEIAGINTRLDLARLERYYQTEQANRLLLQGVALADPHRFDLRGTLVAGDDVSFDINVILEGDVRIGNHVTIGPHCLLRNVTIGDNTEIRAHSVLEEAIIGNHCKIGPFARLRPGTLMEDESHAGNFVEIKNTRLGHGTKVNHLTYLGDSKVGADVNIGAGTITCNYDGAEKHTTTIGDRVFIGSNTLLVAPVTVHDDASVGAGSILTKDAPGGQLTLTAKLEQRTVPQWHRPEKKKEHH